MALGRLAGDTRMSIRVVPFHLLTVPAIVRAVSTLQALHDRKIRDWRAKEERGSQVLTFLAEADGRDTTGIRGWQMVASMLLAKVVPEAWWQDVYAIAVPSGAQSYSKPVNELDPMPGQKGSILL
jgi:hypothetical protein